MFLSTLVVLALSASAFANVFITSPVASTTFTAGQPCTVTWQDDGQQPTLQAFGPAIVSIYAGNSQQQTLLQTITSSVNVATAQAVTFTPDPAIGPNGNQYFIRFQSISLKDATQIQYPALAFSAKFTMSGMTGTFNSTVQSEIDGQSTAPIGGTAVTPTSTPTPIGSTPSIMATSKSSSATAAGGAAKTSTAAGSSSTNDANKLAGASVAIFTGLAFAVLHGLFC